MSARSGRLVVFEGGEGAGKSTQIELARRRAQQAGLEVVTCREPGGTPFGEALRSALLHTGATSARAELLAFNAARAELVDGVIAPALEGGALVLCDRFTASTVAYQQYGRGLDARLVEATIALATEGVTPDLQVLLDLDPTTGLERAGADRDRFEAEARAFHERVRAGFRAQAAAHPERWLIVDGTLAVERIADEVWACLERVLSGV